MRPCVLCAVRPITLQISKSDCTLGMQSQEPGPVRSEVNITYATRELGLRFEMSTCGTSSYKQKKNSSARTPSHNHSQSHVHSSRAAPAAGTPLAHTRLQGMLTFVSRMTNPMWCSGASLITFCFMIREEVTLEASRALYVDRAKQTARS